MRALLARGLLTCLERHTPGWVRRMEAQILLNLAARSFGRKGKRVWLLPAEKSLAAYAAYTIECMKEAEPDPKRLYQNARRLGNRLRRISGFREDKDLQRLVFYLYRNIRITMRGSLPGEILIPDCYFSRLYTPGQCGTMSNMDEGVIAGLYGGGRLQFAERLTEGCGRCRACFRGEGENP